MPAKGAFPSEWTGSAGPRSRGLMMIDDLPSPQCELRRLPGLYRRWELARLLEAGEDYRIEDAGAAEDGTALYAVYKSIPTTSEDKGAM